MKSLFLGLALLSPAILSPGIACAAGLTGQQAVYNLKLEKVRTHDVTGATGQMRYDVVDGCTGWATSQHMTLLVRSVDGTLNKSVTNYTTWEAKDGKTLSFKVSETDNDGKPQVDDAGTATRDAKGGMIDYTTPADTKLALPPGTLFPMAHTEALLAAGAEGKKFISPTLFDGTSADGAEDTFVAILGHDAHTKSSFPALNGMSSSDVDIAFFKRKHRDETPEFRTRMRYFEDGVASKLVLDFGDFIMTGKLVSLKIPPSPCGAQTAR
jgi:hypothetical protein